MIIKGFKARNFGSYAEVAYSFKDSFQISLLHGSNMDESSDDSSNGSGKSTLYDIISYGLYGKSIDGKNLNELVNDQSGKDLYVEIDVDDYKIVRGRKPNKFVVFKDGVDITSIDIQKRLESDWGIGWDIFSFIYRFGGSGVGLVSYLDSGLDFRRKIQDFLVNSEMMSSYLKRARKLRNEIKNKISSLEQKKQFLSESILEDTETFVSMSQKKDAERNSINVRIKEILERQKRWDGFDLYELEKVCSERDSLISQKDSLEKKLSEKISELDQVDSVDCAQKIDGLKEELKQTQIKLEDVLARRKKLEKSLKSTLEEIYFLEESAANCLEDVSCLEKTQRDLIDLEKTLEKCHVDLQEKELIEEKKKRCLVLKEEIDDLKNLLEEFESSFAESKSIIQEMNVDLSDNEKKLAKTDFEIDALKKSLHRIDDEIGELNNLLKKGVCPTCHQDIDKESFSNNVISEKGLLKKEVEEKIEKEIKSRLRTEKIIGEINRVSDDLKKELDGIENNCNCVKEDIDLKKHDYIKIKEEVRVLTAKQKELVPIDVVNKEIAELKNKEKELVEKVAQGKESESLRLQEIKSLREKKNVLEEKKSSFYANSSALESKCSSIKDQIVFYQEEVANKKIKLTKETKEISCSLGLIEKSVLELQGKSQGFFLDDVKRALVEFERDADELERLSLALQENKSDNALKDMGQRLEKKKVDFQTAEEELASLEKDLPYYDFWVEGFDNGGIKNLVIKNMLEILNNQAENFLGDLSGTPVYFKFNEDLYPEIYRIDTKEEFSVRKCSGGQKKRINIAIALAFLTTIKMVFNCDLNLFVVDEAADALDTSGMIGFSNVLEKISGQTNVWVITHNPVLFNQILSRNNSGKLGIEEINIEYSNGTSRLI